MTSANAPLPLRPASVGALLEAAEASGLTDDEIGREIDLHFGDLLVPGPVPFIPELAAARDRKRLEAMIRRAIDIPNARPRLTVVGND